MSWKTGFVNELKQVYKTGKLKTREGMKCKKG